MKTELKPRSGYAFVWSPENGIDDPFRRKDDEDWEIQVITLRGDEYMVGRTRIDGTMCRVFWSKSRMTHVAQTEAFLGVESCS
jgi:hypothetical protein